MRDRSKRSKRYPICRFRAALLLLMMAQSTRLFSESIAVRYKEGSAHGFLVLRAVDGKILAGGDLVQFTRGDRVTSHLVFRFKDGSVDDETSVFTQSGSFRLVSDRHIQKGPTFQHSSDVSINMPKGQVSARLTENSEEKSATEQVNLPVDLANGMLLNVLKNIRSEAKKTTVSYLVATPKPRVIKMVITAQGKEAFSIAGLRQNSTRFVVKVEMGGMAGMLAPMIGKQPPDTNVWVVEQGVPAFVRSEGPLFLGGPIWHLEMISPVWDRPSGTLAR